MLSARQALRSRLVAAALALLVFGTLALLRGAEGDGSPEGGLRVFLSWSQSLQTLVLSLTALMLPLSFAGTLKRGELTTVALTPTPRWQALVGWWVGAALVLAALAGFAQLLCYGGTRWRMYTAPEASQPAMRLLVQAQGTVESPQPDRDLVEEQMQRRLDALERAGQIPPEIDREEALAEFVRGELRDRRTAGPRQSLRWRMQGIRPRGAHQELPLLLRYRTHVVAPPGTPLPEGGVRGRFVVIPPGSGGYNSPPVRLHGRGELRTMKFPRDVLEGGDEVVIEFQNLETQPVDVVFSVTGIQVLYPAGGFLGNLLRVWAVLVGRLWFMAALGLGLCAALEGRLAVLVASGVLAIGSAHEFLRDALRVKVYGSLDAPLKAVVSALLSVLPNLGRDDLGGLLSLGVQVTGASVGASLLDGLARGGLCLALGAWILTRRELGAIR